MLFEKNWTWSDLKLTEIKLIWLYSNWSTDEGTDKQIGRLVDLTIAQTERLTDRERERDHDIEIYWYLQKILHALEKGNNLW